MRAIAIVVAGGSGLRAGGGLAKQYALIGGEPVLRRSLCAFLAHETVDGVIAVIRAGDEALFARCAAGLGPRLLAAVTGGATRQESVLEGLRAATGHAPEKVLIHDAARPFVTGECISKVLAALETHQGAIAARPLFDTLKRAEGRLIAGNIDRAGLWQAQTPQAFRFAPICAAHEAASAEGRTDFTDDAALAEWHGLDVALVDSLSHNMKITSAEDLRIADFIARAERPALPAADMRTGMGFDVHAFEPGDHVTLCGVRIPHECGLKGHSDADAGLHALTDALLGTIGAGDIGDHFPPSDPRWRDADSALFLRWAASLISERGGRVANADVTLICERPKIGPHREAMRARIAELLGVDLVRVSVKATTSEGLGFTGRREGIAAMATATVAFTKETPDGS
jgi:2-C-methyl-D-erythritol 4-phosphate cytidylyltransferase/2-C-methyl-D-erythritol 2,4-cyclodiphosphate synthase